MAIEIEKKYRLSDAQREKVLEELRELGADFKGEDFEENIIYSGSVLEEKLAVLRVRKTQAKTILTYKESVPSPAGIKRRIEYETEVEDGEAAENIVESLGFRRKLVYEKRRKTWHFREVEIVLDELPFGLFMEIEGSITAIKEAEMLLDIEDFPAEPESYPRLTARLGKQNGDSIEARFSENFL